VNVGVTHSQRREMLECYYYWLA